MNEIIRTEAAVDLFGVTARAFAVVADTSTGRILNQKIGTTRYYTEAGHAYRIAVEVRFDDGCRNGHESFSITGSIDEKTRTGSYREYSGGCIHEEIAKHFPELAHLIKWHLMSTDGPMHYIANTCYHASDRDCNGLLAGESRQIKNGRTGELCWHLVGIGPDGAEIEVYNLPKYADGEKPADTYALAWRPWCTIGTGKAREFEHARSSAVWPEATDEQLSLPRAELEALLAARLPALLADFKADMLAAGLLWPVEVAEVVPA